MIRFFIGLMIVISSTVCFAEDYTQRKAVHEFFNLMEKKHGFSKSELNTLFSNIETQISALKAIAKPFEDVPWYKYEERFITEKRISEGVLFWKMHQATLNRAFEKFGVPPEMIVAIIGIETFYGDKMGNYPVLDALTTLAFNYPPRAAFFKSELEQFLLLTKEEKLNPKTIKGSYAGAMGMPQFISSSYRKLAIDFSGKGQRNLLSNTEDAIGSVANYFKANGWQKNGPILLAIQSLKKIDSQKAKNVNNPTPNKTINQWQQEGFILQENHLPLNLLSAHLRFENKLKQTEHFLGFNNFYVITRYNRSSNYARAVYELSECIKKSMNDKAQ
ncbi:MAG: lytic murein transglycosylase [Francisellaceae bacterium]|nr:lytic murein transglycosylase [Francisellaceae bacterium]